MAAIAEIRAFLAASLVTPVERTRTESASARRRRRVVVGVTVVLGAVGLRLALAVRPGDPLFYLASLGVALLWIAGAIVSGPPSRRGAYPQRGHEPRSAARVPAGAPAAGRLPGRGSGRRAGADPAGTRRGLLDHARYGALWVVALVTAVNGIAEELFFRGAVYAALPPRINALGSTALYAASTLFSGCCCSLSPPSASGC